MFRKLCGDTTLKNVILVTNMWGVDSQDANESREGELSSRFFKPALDKGAQMVRHHNTTQSAHEILRRIIKNRPAVLQIQRELVDEGKDIVDTAAGESINEELKEQIRRHQKELKELREEIMEALEAKDNQVRQELEDARKVLEEKIKGIETASQTMAANFAAEKERMAAKIRQMERETRQARERAKAEYDWELAILTGHNQRTPDASADDRAEWEQEIKKLQDRITIPIYE